MSLPDKISDLMKKLKQAVLKGQLNYSQHAVMRMRERDIVRLEVEYVLKNGFHEKRKDLINEAFGSWDYAVRGKTLDGRRLRIIVAFERPHFLVITTIDLEK